MPTDPALILSWARSAVAPHGGGLRRLQAHDIAAPVVQALLARALLPPNAVDALVVGNALAAGGNPARMVSFAAGLDDACAAFSVDTQCCSGLDAVSLGVSLVKSGQASVVIAGGVEAWSRAPIRQTRPLQAGDPALAYDRPAFCPDPQRDPDLLESAARYATRHGYSRTEQDAYAIMSHRRAIEYRREMAEEIVAVAGLMTDAYPRALTPMRAARMPVVVQAHNAATPTGQDCSLSALSISTRADAAAFVLLASAAACRRLGLRSQFAWLANASIGSDPVTPLEAAEKAANGALARAGIRSADELEVLELHDAFAVQALGFCQAMKISPQRINSCGGGLARGHPIGASGAIALVRLLADLKRNGRVGAHGLVAIAGAGGMGSAAVVRTA